MSTNDNIVIRTDDGDFNSRELISIWRDLDGKTVVVELESGQRIFTGQSASQAWAQVMEHSSEVNE